MQTFDLADIASDRRRSSIVLPPIFDSQGAQTDYLRALRAIRLNDIYTLRHAQRHDGQAQYGLLHHP